MFWRFFLVSFALAFLFSGCSTTENGKEEEVKGMGLKNFNMLIKTEEEIAKLQDKVRELELDKKRIESLKNVRNKKRKLAKIRLDIETATSDINTYMDREKGLKTDLEKLEGEEKDKIYDLFVKEGEKLSKIKKSMQSELNNIRVQGRALTPKEKERLRELGDKISSLEKRIRRILDIRIEIFKEYIR